MTLAEQFGPHLITAGTPRIGGARWTPERDEVLKRLWASGMSASQVAAEIGEVTRNAVIGRVHRLGLSGRVKAPSSPRPRSYKPRSYVSREALRVERITHQDVVEEEPEAVVIDEEIPAEQRTTIFDLTDQTCKWPVGNPGESSFFFCGGQTATGSAYCACHARTAHQPPRQRRAA